MCKVSGSTVRTNKKKLFSIHFQSTSLRNVPNNFIWISHSLLFSMKFLRWLSGYPFKMLTEQCESQTVSLSTTEKATNRTWTIIPHLATAMECWCKSREPSMFVSPHSLSDNHLESLSVELWNLFWQLKSNRTIRNWGAKSHVQSSDCTFARHTIVGRQN